MPTELCRYGFSCAAMMMAPGLNAIDCPNRDICGTIVHLSDDERIELYHARLEQSQRVVEMVRIGREEAANVLLMSRGCPQTPESLGVIAAIGALQAAIGELESTIAQLSTGYIAPVEAHAHRYLVKRPSGVYQYNKLTSNQAIFPPQNSENSVKVLHLSHDFDPRNIIGRAGIERRNRLTAFVTALQAATNIVQDAHDRGLESSIDVDMREQNGSSN